jgi:hypothetical protein
MSMDQLQTLLRQIRARRHAAADTLADESYRAILQRCASVTSSTGIKSIGKAKAVITEFDRLGVGRPAGRAPLTAMQKKMWSLWQQLADRGLVDNRKMPGLVAWVARQTGVEQLAWLTWPQERNCVEALKRWLVRGEEGEAHV